MNTLREYIENKIKLSDEEWQLVVSIFKKKTYKKGEHIVDTEYFNKYVWYISSGLIRPYYINNDGEEVTKGLLINHPKYPHGRFLGDIASYFLGKESDLYVEVLEESTIYECSFQDLDALFEKSLNLMKLGKLYMQEQLIILEIHYKTIRDLGAKERYLLYKEHAPILEELLSNSQFASLLNIAPQSLSRIKNS